jgi:ATP-dependent DNA ligase
MLSPRGAAARPAGQLNFIFCHVYINMDYSGRVSADGMRFEFEKQIYKAQAQDKLLQWQIFVEVYSSNDEQQPIADEYKYPASFPPGWFAKYYTESGYVDGKIKISEPTIVHEGKNLGKKNETTPYSQALSEANHKHIQNMRHRTLTVDLEMQTEKFIPLQKLELYDPKKITSFDNLYIEPKFNGTHAAAILNADNEVELRSTQNKEYEGEIIKRGIKSYMHHRIILEGELWIKGWRLQDITSQAKNPLNHGRALQYVLFDCIMLDDMDADQYTRKKYLWDTFDRPEIHELRTSEGLPAILIAPTIKVNSFEDINKIFKIYIDGGFEGAVIRDYSLAYKPAINKARSKNMKLKNVMDDEFEVIGFTQGTKGKGHGQIMFICQTEAGQEFSVTPSENEVWRRTEYTRCATEEGYFENTYLGKMYTIEYRDVTADGIPSHAVGKVFEWDKK